MIDNEYFINIVKDLGIFTEKESATFTENKLSGVEMVLNKYNYHHGINAITELMKNLITLLSVSFSSDIRIL